MQPEDVTARRISPGEGALLRRIRLAALADAPGAFWQTLAGESAQPDEYWDAMARAGADSSRDLVAFVEVGGEPVGMVQGYVATGRPWVRSLGAMWVTPSARGTGAAAALLDTAIGWARAAGAEAVKLWVAVGNQRAQRAYARHGFVLIGEPRPITDDPTVKVYLPMLLSLYPAGAVTPARR